jgi:hypothetical protein
MGEDAECMGEMRNAHDILGGKSEMKGPFTGRKLKLKLSLCLVN